MFLHLTGTGRPYSADAAASVTLALAVIGSIAPEKQTEPNGPAKIRFRDGFKYSGYDYIMVEESAGSINAALAAADIDVIVPARTISRGHGSLD